ncbi:thiamine biosynthesis protein ThiS [Hylemonella gracilis str. Niagara R]|uniref:Thiamine biosynthesis protein ThiS n=1 Tax=Hylemonella gracilis str. Niagara R TaxID=1458275 RepID=A0A016XHT6_9BURK|nr:sulfur carrier protein ThiS [Hylemonella gracilis]EYC51649.1 thiamine biosynthesis protein ThiS [Hylemonella gracilis str. Niagara R]
MKVLINQQTHELDSDATLADAVAAIEARPPFAAAVNTQFVPRTQYAQHPLRDGDQVEIIAPVTGG